MAHTDVRFTQQNGAFRSDVSDVPIVSGDTVTFYADPAAETNLCMTEATTAIFTPPPDPAITIAAGGKVALTFSHAAPGSYFISTHPPAQSHVASHSKGSTKNAVLNVVTAQLLAARSSPDTDLQS